MKPNDTIIYDVDGLQHCARLIAPAGGDTWRAKDCRGRGEVLLKRTDIVVVLGQPTEGGF